MIDITDEDRATIELIANMPTPSEEGISRDALLTVFGPLVANIKPEAGVDPNYLTIYVRIGRGLCRPEVDNDPALDVRRLRFGIYSKHPELNRASDKSGPWTLLDVEGYQLLKVSG